MYLFIYFAETRVWTNRVELPSAVTHCHLFNSFLCPTSIHPQKVYIFRDDSWQSSRCGTARKIVYFVICIVPLQHCLAFAILMQQLKDSQQGD